MVRPAREVGGDFYDFFFIDQPPLVRSHRRCGRKGVPAAIFMAVSKALIKATAQSKISLPQDRGSCEQ
jgi:sigma-B regulation protein RsbU (phosphoserine phosphatase)